MHSKGPGFSIGSILTLVFTGVVVIGCMLAFSTMRGESGNTAMDAQRVIGVLGEALQGNAEATTLPSPTIRTVTVTLSPDNQQYAAQPAATQTPAPVLRTLRITAAGLAGFSSDVADAFYDKEQQDCDYTALLAGIQPHVDGDLNLVTLYSVLIAQGKEYSDTIAHPAAASALKNAGFDMALLANERFLDQGAQSALDTAAALQERGLDCCGIAGQGVQAARLIERNGVKIGILSYTDQLNSKGKNTLHSSAGQGLCTPYDEEDARQDIANLRAQGAEVVIVCMNWGQADAQQATAKQRDIARNLTAMGADMILGTRPSRILSVERIVTSSEDGGGTRQAVAAYSLGTLVTESRQGYDISGALLHFDLAVSDLHEVEIQSVSYTPTYIWRQKIDGKWQYRLVCSDEAAPAEMSQDQQEVMGRALKRVQDALQNVDMLQWE